MQCVNYNGYLLRVIALTAAIALRTLLFPPNSNSQIISDTSTNTNIQTTDDLLEISGGLTAGNNLFHSFTEFSVSSNSTASFTNDLAIENIFSRVTGGITSEIDGLLRTQGDASLFLLNPAGIIFGGDAQLDVGGSFIATTGDRLIFEDGVEFGLTNQKSAPLLSISTPIGLQYGTNPGAIEVLANVNRTAESSGLQIQPGNTLGLLGGDIKITRNNIDAVGSDVEIVSVKSGVIGLQANQGWQFNYQNINQLGQITLENSALINTSGRAHLKGQDLNINNGSGIRDFNIFGQEQSEIQLEGNQTIQIDGGLLVTQAGQPNSPDQVPSQSGNITISAPQVSITNGAVVSAGTLGDGAGGNITISAPEVVTLTTEAEHNPAIISTSTSGLGQGGQINIDTRELSIKKGSQIQALAGEGAGGTIKLQASKSIEIDGQGILRSEDFEGNLLETNLQSGVFATSGVSGIPMDLQPQGKSGNLEIITPQLNLTNQGQISVSNYGPGNAGDISIKGSEINLDNLGEIVANTASGEGGSIEISAQENFILDSQSLVTTAAQQNGNGGNISISAKNLVLLDQNQINANAQQGNGGNIKINSQGLFIEPKSSITASSQVEQNEGVVEINTLDLNNRLNTDYQGKKPIQINGLISRGCGTNHSKTHNQFRDIGQGGISSNPLKETANQELLGDLGIVTLPNFKNLSNYQKTYQVSFQELTEANSWQINNRGIVQLLNQPDFDIFDQISACRLLPNHRIPERS